MEINSEVLSWVVVSMAAVVILGGISLYYAIKLVAEKVATILEAHNEIITEDRTFGGAGRIVGKFARCIK